jgi:hypothetical protein
MPPSRPSGVPAPGPTAADNRPTKATAAESRKVFMFTIMPTIRSLTRKRFNQRPNRDTAHELNAAREVLLPHRPEAEHVEAQGQAGVDPAQGIGGSILASRRAAAGVAADRCPGVAGVSSPSERFDVTVLVVPYVRLVARIRHPPSVAAGARALSAFRPVCPARSGCQWWRLRTKRRTVSKIPPTAAIISATAKEVVAYVHRKEIWALRVFCASNKTISAMTITAAAQTVTLADPTRVRGTDWVAPRRAACACPTPGWARGSR